MSSRNIERHQLALPSVCILIHWVYSDKLLPKTLETTMSTKLKLCFSDAESLKLFHQSWIKPWKLIIEVNIQWIVGGKLHNCCYVFLEFVVVSFRCEMKLLREPTSTYYIIPPLEICKKTKQTQPTNQPTNPKSKKIKMELYNHSRPQFSHLLYWMLLSTSWNV